MEKLVKLLNEAHRSGAMLFGFCTGRFEWKFYAENQWRLTVNDLCGHDDIYYFSNRDICGKDGGFIERLVKEDKVDLENLIIKKVEDRGGNKVIKDIKYYSEIESLLMILSIQDNPIEFLVSIIK